MRAYRDAAAIQAAVTAFDDPGLSALIATRIEELSEYEDYDLGDLVNIFVIEPGDALTDIDAELGFVLMRQTHRCARKPPRLVRNHRCAQRRRIW